MLILTMSWCDKTKLRFLSLAKPKISSLRLVDLGSNVYLSIYFPFTEEKNVFTSSHFRGRTTLASHMKTLQLYQ